MDFDESGKVIANRTLDEVKREVERCMKIYDPQHNPNAKNDQKTLDRYDMLACELMRLNSIDIHKSLEAEKCG